MERFRAELYEHLKNFRSHRGLSNLSVTVTGHPRTCLTVAFRPLGQDPARPSEIVREAAKVSASAGVGAGVSAAAGVVIGKLVFGTVVTRVSVASAAEAIGVPILVPLAAVGGVVGSIAYGFYKLGKWRRGREVAKEFAKELIAHMDRFSPSAAWPNVEVYLSIPELGLSAFWQPECEV